MQYPLSLILLIALSILCSSAAQICQKLAAQTRTNTTGLYTNAYFITSITLMSVALCSWLAILGRMDVSIAYPLLSLNFLLVLLAAKFYFGENVPPHRWAGALIILIGIFTLLDAGSV